MLPETIHCVPPGRTWRALAPSAWIGLAFLSAAFATAALPTAASAHVKWFAPYIVNAAPQPIGDTLTDAWFWTGIILVLIFFLATVAVERRPLGQGALASLDRITDPLARRADDFMRATTAAFFVAIFAVGGVYLTPDLQTPSELVSWAQLAIAAGIFSRKTMPFSAAGIIVLWVVALRDYDFFHLLDYLALGVGVAGYLLLASLDDPHWRGKRFAVLFWGVAIALMWSSLEKFAYPNWFYPLVEEKPFLTFGMPRDVFIPMAGVAEFTLGFGLIWSPLVRRLSAISLLVIFTTAVYPFGRIDLVGHAMIMAALVLIAADPIRKVQEVAAPVPVPVLPKRRLAAVPASLAVAIVAVASSYWGLHAAFYGAGYGTPAAVGEMATHAYSAEHPHGPGGTAVGEPIGHSH